MAIDRESSLRRAEKLLRQGRLDAAIEEYLRLIEDQPNDWNTANLVGDLFVRAGQLDRAAAQYTRIADHFGREGFLPKAVALYRKVLKVRPDDEHALLKSAEIAGRQGHVADARAALSAVMERRQRRGDRRGAAEVAAWLSELDPGDLAARLQAARAAAEVGDRAVALERFRGAASDLVLKGRAGDAAAVLLEALALDEGDAGVRSLLVRALVNAGDPDGARKYATEAGHLREVAAALGRSGREAEVAGVLEEVVGLDPADAEGRAELVRRLLAAGDTERAARFVPAEGEEASPDLLLMAAEVALSASPANTRRARAFLEAAQRRSDMGLGPSIVALGCRLGAADPAKGFACIEAAVGPAVAAGAWPAAANALEQFLEVSPGHVPALTRLVDVAVDGDLSETLLRAQGDLADAYLRSGHAEEARVIAEDLLGRQPQNQRHVDRLRQALERLGVEDPDRVIADHLSDLLTEPTTGEEPPRPAEEGALPPAASRAEREPEPGGTPPGTSDVFRLSAGAVDLRDILEDDGSPGEAAPGPLEVDLSDAVGGLGLGTPAAPVASTAGVGPRPPQQIEGVFDEFRQEVQRERSAEVAEQHIKLAAMFEGIGMKDEAIKALEVAVRSSRHRFEAASQLGRLLRDRGELAGAIEWFERAAEAPASSGEAGHALLYDLGDVLERSGETARALAVFLELQTDAGPYRDVPARIDRLSQAGE